MNEKSLYQRRDRKKEAFVPQAVTEVTEQADSEEMNEYVLKPLYTQKEIREFRKQNEQDGNFIVTKDTVKSMEDLEKLFLVWQDATEVAEGTEEIEVGEELENENGLRFSKLVIKKISVIIRCKYHRWGLVPQHHNKKDKDKGKHMVNLYGRIVCDRGGESEENHFRAVSADMHFTSKIRSGHINAEG